MIIEQPHGYLLDDDGRVVIRFANWQVGDHAVPEHIVDVDYVGGSNAHTKNVHSDYKTQNE